jgi:hypothetical protein
VISSAVYIESGEFFRYLKVGRVPRMHFSGRIETTTIYKYGVVSIWQKDRNLDHQGYSRIPTQSTTTRVLI